MFEAEESYECDLILISLKIKWIVLGCKLVHEHIIKTFKWNRNITCSGASVFLTNCNDIM